MEVRGGSRGEERGVEAYEGGVEAAREDVVPVEEAGVGEQDRVFTEGAGQRATDLREGRPAQQRGLVLGGGQRARGVEEDAEGGGHGFVEVGRREGDALGREVHELVEDRAREVAIDDGPAGLEREVRSLLMEACEGVRVGAEERLHAAEVGLGVELGERRGRAGEPGLPGPGVLGEGPIEGLTGGREAIAKPRDRVLEARQGREAERRVEEPRVWVAARGEEGQVRGRDGVEVEEVEVETRGVVCEGEAARERLGEAAREGEAGRRGSAVGGEEAPGEETLPGLEAGLLEAKRDPVRVERGGFASTSHGLSALRW